MDFASIMKIRTIRTLYYAIKHKLIYGKKNSYRSLYKVIIL